MNRESVVYVIQQPSQSRDFKSAGQYGRLEFLLGAEERVGLLPAKAIQILRRKLRSFTKNDYIVWAGGDPIAPVLAGIVLGEMGFTEINFLRWERERDNSGQRSGLGYYIPGKLMLRNIFQQTKISAEDL